MISSQQAADRLGVDKSTFLRRAERAEITPAFEGVGLRGPKWWDEADVDKLAAAPAAVQGSDVPPGV